MNGNPHVGDEGTELELTVMVDAVAQDISDATAKWIRLVPPVGSVIEKTADFKTDGTDGVLTATTTAGDFSIAGRWGAQAKITTPAGTWSSKLISFIVDPNP